MAREEGEVNIVQWAGLRAADEGVHGGDGLQVNTKDGASSDDMISLMQTGEYDGVSASGNASVRLMTTGDVAPSNPELRPELRGRAGGDQEPGLQQPRRRAVRRAARPRAQLPDVPHRRVPEDTDSWSVIWEDDQLGQVQREDLDLRRLDLHRGRRALPEGDAARPRDRQPVHAQRGAVQRGRRPAQEAGAERRRVLAGRRGEADPVVHERRQRGRDDLAVPVRPADRRRSAGAGQGDQAEGGHDRLVGHVDDLLEGAEPELHVPLDEPHDLARRRRRRWRRASARRPST